MLSVVVKEVEEKMRIFIPELKSFVVTVCVCVVDEFDRDYRHLGLL